MKQFARFFTLVIFTLALSTSVLMAQEATEEADLDVVPLVPYTSEPFALESLRPETWTDVGNGIFTRQNSATDTTLIAIQSAVIDSATVMTALLPQLSLTEVPESVGTYAGVALEWTLYQVDVPAGDQTIRVDLALSELEGTTYVVLMQTLPEEYESLHATVFLPLLDGTAPLVVEEEDVPYVVEDVTFTNGDITLAGTLTLPPTEGPHPVVVLVSGSGPQNRDENLGVGVSIRPFRLLADGLTRAGVAVLRYDDRGVAESTGEFSEATTQDFALDAAAAIDYLLTRSEINPNEIGLLGHSEGGLVAAILGASNPDLDFIISMAGPGVNGREVLILQNQLIFQSEGLSQEEIDVQLAFLDELFPLIDAGDVEGIESLTYERVLQQVETLTEEERASLGDVEVYARNIASQNAQQYGAEWFRSFLNYDPAPDWAQTTIPVLALFGGKDVQVDDEQNAPALEAALVEAGNEDYEIVVLPNANHLFQEAETGGMSEYGTLPGEFTPDFLPTIIEWLQTHVTIAE